MHTETPDRNHSFDAQPAKAAGTRLPIVKLLAILILGFSGGCNLVKTTLELPDKAIQAILSLNKEGVMIDPVDLQSQLIRYSDYYLAAIISASGKLRIGEDNLPDRRMLLKRRIAVTDDILAIATGANAYANLLDLVMLVSVTRMNIEDYWKPQRFGDSALPLLAAAKDSEKEIWRIAESVLSQEQVEELHSGIDAWREKYKDGRIPRDVSTLSFATEIARLNKSGQQDKPSSVFNLLIIDPFAGLDPATSELANTRLFAERGLFLARHMPTLMRWETELLGLQMAEIPQVEKLLTSSAQLTASAERFSQVSERLPAFISGERQQIVQALDLQRPGLISLAAQSERAMTAGKQMSDATAAALKVFQDVLKQLADSPSDPQSEPFNIREYTAAAAQIKASAEQLSNLLAAFNQTTSPERLDAVSTRMGMLSQQAEASSKAVVDYAFNQMFKLGAILIALTCIMVLATSWLFWMLKKKFAAP